MESPIYKMYFDSLKDDAKKRRVDIEISSPESFMSKNTRRQVFAEVKWVWRGIHEARGTYLTDIMHGIEDDLEKLQYLSQKGCCEHAYMCIIDEEPAKTHIDKQKKLEWERKFKPVKVLLESYQRARE